MKRILLSTLLAGLTLAIAVLVINKFTQNDFNFLNAHGFMLFVYSTFIFLPFLFLTFLILNFIIRITLRYNLLSIPVRMLISFIYFSSIFILFSFGESYIKEFNTYIFIFLSSLILTICSLPIISHVK